MSSDVKVSVIVPVYNTEKYLQKCLDSLINQTLKDIEIICINDGSTDNSENIIRMFAKEDSRIKLINQENKKQGAARNAGMKIATGEYIGFVDSDDYVDLNYFERLCGVNFNNTNYAILGGTRMPVTIEPNATEILSIPVVNLYKEFTQFIEQGQLKEKDKLNFYVRDSFDEIYKIKTKVTYKQIKGYATMNPNN